MRRTKILVTLGPATDSPTILRELAGTVDGFRINFSHGDDESHRTRIRRARGAIEVGGRNVALVADLQGPKMRLGDIEAPPWTLTEGDTLSLSRPGRPGEGREVTLEVPTPFSNAARTGDPILVGDGQVALRAEKVSDEAISTRVTRGGLLMPHAGIYLPRARLRTDILGPKDMHDLGVALEARVDFIALSFVRSGEDVGRARKAIEARRRGNQVGIIAKIERAEALDHASEILERADGIMVARGDLGVEVPLERLALEQKSLLRRANRVGRFGIVATQMLLSMVRESRPTRAEATDVANAVLDGADVLMLSEESAIGAHPAEATAWLDRIARTTEKSIDSERFRSRTETPTRRVESSVAEAAVRLAEEVGAAAIVTPTHSGRTARLVSVLRPRAPVIALTSTDAVSRQLALVWGVHPFRAPARLPLDRLRDWAVRAARRTPGVSRTGPLVMTAGYPVSGRPTNLLNVIETRDHRRQPPRPR